ncbi:MAG: hypothetical protein ACI9DM_000227 [Cyclobacteriaceae bacterium]|jgi:hypothetical protein
MNHSVKVITLEGEKIEMLFEAKSGREALAKYQRLFNEPIKEISIVNLPETKLLPEHAFQVLFNGYPEDKDGFACFCETHYLVVEAILEMRNQDENSQPVKFREYYDNGGTGMLMEAAKVIAMQFEEQHQGIDWDGDYWEAVKQFLLDVNWEEIA